MNSYSLERLFVLLDALMVADPEIIRIAKHIVNDEVTTEDEDYAWDKYGIDLRVIRCWVMDRKLGNQSWQTMAACKWEKSE